MSSKHTTSPIKIRPYKTNLTRGYEAVTESEGVPDCPVAHFARKADADLFAASSDLLAALEALEDAERWDASYPTIRDMKLARQQIHARWSPKIEGYFNDSEQLRALARKLRQDAIAKATGQPEPHTD